MRGGGLPWPGSSDLSESTSRNEELLMGNGSRLPKAEPLKSQSPETELLESIPQLPGSPIVPPRAVNTWRSVFPTSLCWRGRPERARQGTTVGAYRHMYEYTCTRKSSYMYMYQIGAYG